MSSLNFQISTPLRDAARLRSAHCPSFLTFRGPEEFFFVIASVWPPESVDGFSFDTPSSVRNWGNSPNEIRRTFGNSQSQLCQVIC